ncbi:MAG: hypothetical protein Q7K28_03105 [Candidatus Wildermuthbacteria bacterium]|nr:hypothetical protein [Candidatus Wildermuthbacteria bacterium]
MPRESEIRKKAVTKLTDENWIYWYPPKVKFKQNDIFGVFDIICCKKKVGDLKFIQLTTVSNLSARRKKIQNFLTENKIHSKLSRNADLEIWAWSKRHKSFKIELM